MRPAAAARPGATGNVEVAAAAAGATAGDLPAEWEADPLGEELGNGEADNGVESFPVPIAADVDVAPAAAEELGVVTAGELPVAVEVLEQPATVTAHMTAAASTVARARVFRVTMDGLSVEVRV